MQDIFVACVDGLKGFPEAIEAVFPQTAVQLCVVHMVRHSLNYVTWKRRPEVAADLSAAERHGRDKRHALYTRQSFESLKRLNDVTTA